MTKRTRYFIGGSAAVLAVGLGTGLVAYFTGGFQSVSAAPVAHELRYVPADSAVIAYADVRSVMDSDLRQRLKAALPGDGEGQQEFQAQTGIDIERDIDYIVAAATGVSDSPDGLIVARGRFNDGQLETLARQHGGEVEEYKGKRLVSSPREGDKQFTLAFLEPGLIAIGTRATVQRAVDAQLTSHSITSNNEMMELVADLGRQSLPANAWAVGRFDAIAKQANLPAELQQRMPPVKWFAASGHVNGGIQGSLRVEATDDAAADLLRRQISGALAFGEMMARSDPKAAALINSLQMTGTGKTVAVAFRVPAELLAIIPQVVEK
ncbi:MAG TPA: hypothetical protein VM364_14540 [Vicinamibacterales bacterium]|nr:hypothetical protein [Vicinamibacterales bacterium]